MYISEIVPLEGKRKGKSLVKMGCHESVILRKKDIERYNLRPESDLPVEAWAKIKTETLYPRAKEYALYLLEKQDRTEYNIIQKLRSGGYSEDVVSDTL